MASKCLLEYRRPRACFALMHSDNLVQENLKILEILEILEFREMHITCLNIRIVINNENIKASSLVIIFSIN